MEYLQRSTTCGALTIQALGQQVILNGWVHRKRDHGGISFINLRDRYGITQVVIDADADDELKKIAATLKFEYCIAVQGKVRARPDTMINKDMVTGEIEVVAEVIQVLAASETPPFMVDEKTIAGEDLRLKYRYLDLRSLDMQYKIALRHRVAFAVREFLVGENFYEIETPTFIRSTPEGARDYLVPSRLYPGKFYALPQSPQLYKQLLMMSGMDKYFQLARCYRDEDARGDRQPEFTQIDIEMSFVKRDDVLGLIERMMGKIFSTTLNYSLPANFTRITYEDAIDRYGTDKPDMRFAMHLHSIDTLARKTNFEAFKTALAEGDSRRAENLNKGINSEAGAVKALVVKGKADYSRKQIEELEAVAKIYKVKGMAFIKVNANGEFEAGASKFFTDCVTELKAELGAEPGDLILMVADSYKSRACKALGAVRSKLGKDLNLTDPKKFEFAWIVDFPMFEWNEELNKWDAAHHLFTMPQAQYHASLEQDPGSVKGDLYDLVLNGFELASGSIRIHTVDLQNRIFNIVGFSTEEANKKFGFLTEAFKYGPPPHGGIAPGLDRLVMLMAGETTIREVIAYPKNTFATSPMDESPNEVDPSQLAELHIAIVDKK